MDDGPWIFRGCALMLEEFDGATPTPSVIPSKVLAWVQIHKVPPLYRSEKIIKQLVGKVGQEIAVDMNVVSTVNGDFHRARVKLDAAKLLARFVTLAPEGRASMLLQVKYEKMPRFCAHCGHMGHVHLECGTGEFKEEQLQYGDWMLAAVDTWHAGTPLVRPTAGSDQWRPRESNQGANRGGRTERGRRGRGGRTGNSREEWKKKAPEDPASSRKRGSGEAGLATSPVKPLTEPLGQDSAVTAKKQLCLDSAIQENTSAVPPPPPQYVSPRDKKRMKQQGSQKSGGDDDNKLAGSEEECRPVQ